MSLLAWSTRLGIKYRTLLQRINRGLSFEEAIEHKFYGRLPKSYRLAIRASLHLLHTV